MRASAEIIGSIILIAAVVLLGLAFLALFVSQYQIVAAERLKIAEINKIKVNVDMGVIYSNRTGTGNRTDAQLVYVVEFVNIGEETSFYLVPAWGKLASDYAVLGLPAYNAYLVRGVSHLRNIEQCPMTPHCVRVQARISPDRIFTEQEIALAELGSRRAEAPLVKIDLPTRGSKIVFLSYPWPSDRSPGESPLLLLLASVNNKYYLASVRELPTGE